MMRKIIFGLICWFGMVLNAFAATPVEELTQRLNSIHTMKANFTQTVYDNHGKAIQKAYGLMALERPGKFRWETKRPVPQLIIANESKLWIYDPDLDQVTVRALKLAAGDAPALLLSHVNSTIGQDYAISRKESKNGLQWFELQPKNADNNYSNIRLGFENGQIKEMLLDDHLGHSTRIAFTQAKMNTTLTPSLFIFKASSKVDVIDETRKK